MGRHGERSRAPERGSSGRRAMGGRGSGAKQGVAEPGRRKERMSGAGRRKVRCAAGQGRRRRMRERDEGKSKRKKEKKKKKRERGLKERNRDQTGRWKGLFVKNRKERRVAARCRGWERKTARAGIRVCSRVCLAGLLGLASWATLSQPQNIYFSFAN